MLPPDTHINLSDLWDAYLATVEQINEFDNNYCDDIRKKYANFLIQEKYPERYNRRDKFCKATRISIDAYNRFRTGGGVNRITLLKICMGLILDYQKSIICYAIHGYFLLTDNYFEQNILYVLSFLNDTDFKKLDIDEKIEKIKKFIPEVETMRDGA